MLSFHHKAAATATRRTSFGPADAKDGLIVDDRTDGHIPSWGQRPASRGRLRGKGQADDRIAKPGRSGGQPCPSVPDGLATGQRSAGQQLANESQPATHRQWLTTYLPIRGGRFAGTGKPKPKARWSSRPKFPAVPQQNPADPQQVACSLSLDGRRPVPSGVTAFAVPSCRRSLRKAMCQVGDDDGTAQRRKIVQDVGACGRATARRA